MILKTRLLKDMPALLFPGSDGHSRVQITWKAIKELLPVVAVLMENGRMVSIALAVLKKHCPTLLVVEAALVSRILKCFMASNGLCRLVDKASLRHMVAASSIAVHMFPGLENGKRYPQTDPEFELFLNDMSFSLPLAHDVLLKTKIKDLVSKYGLLEPNTSVQNMKPGAIIETPFVMKPAQELIALFMLDVEFDRMLESTPLGFETLSIHVVKCAIAASIAIDSRFRPNLQGSVPNWLSSRRCRNKR
jgi:hypothetical protein